MTEEEQKRMPQDMGLDDILAPSKVNGRKDSRGSLFQRIGPLVKIARSDFCVSHAEREFLG